ncbi:hypothetical protein [Lentzea flava]|uniref:Uncharacterized protein n=1 Tax=Lentzea flava TaxID=103732 RepID=A0ABQ2V7L3_9PSEU|nr:hypothetical protein [Lentzea flava]MCP2198151.1 hypothetical protein [Lentzea flava]GGU70903.1 hypothetical protein GCM10010178_73260 [Lentzea flava]
MRDVLDDDLAELYPVRGADDVRLARLREQLFAEKPVRRSPRWAGIAAAAVAVIMITGLVVFLRPAHRDAPATMPSTPATSLAEAATLLELAEQPTARYQHITYRLREVATAASFGLDQVGWTLVELEYDVWLPTAKGETVFIFRRETGQRQPISGAQPRPEQKLSTISFPQLWTSFCAATPCKEESVSKPLPADPKQKLLAASPALLSPFTTNEEKAALYRVLAESPEIRWDNGRLSVDGNLLQFVIDPATGRVTGTEEVATASSQLPKGMPPQSMTITYEWTDQRPS